MLQYIFFICHSIRPYSLEAWSCEDVAPARAQVGGCRQRGVPAGGGPVATGLRAGGGGGRA
jgi:hypothetical protein